LDVLGVVVKCTFSVEFASCDVNGTGDQRSLSGWRNT